MKQDTLYHNYLNTTIQQVLLELHWIKIKLLKIVRTTTKKEQLKSKQFKKSTISYEHEYLLASVQERILR